MSYTHFSKSERLELSILLQKGYSIRDIGRTLGRNPSTVSRELRRNMVNGAYDPLKADHTAYRKRLYAKYQGMKIRGERWLEEYVHEKLRIGWSPEQIAGRLKLENGGRTIVGFKGIYKYLYSAYGQPYCQYLRYKRYSPKIREYKKTSRELIKNRVGIEQRPVAINERRRYRDFEGDTLGAPARQRERLAGLADRRSRYLMAEKIKGLGDTIPAFRDMLSQVRDPRSVTLDNGIENQRHEELGLPTYFCHPYSSWEKGTIEHAFWMLRKYIPKRKPLRYYAKERIAAIVDQLNRTPRKCLGYRTPYEVFKGQLRLPC